MWARKIFILFLCFFVFMSLCDGARRRAKARRGGKGKPKVRRVKSEIPIRLDIHLAGGLGKSWAFQDDIKSRLIVIDIDGKALLKKSDVKHKIPKKYDRMVGEEIYIGHLFVPNCFAFAVNSDSASWDFYVDWSPIGIKLFKRPKRATNAAPVNFQMGLNVLLAYHLLKYGDEYYHTPDAGLSARAEFRARIARPLSFKAAIFQNGFLPVWNKDVDGDRDKENIMPHLGGVVAGFVYHIYMSRRI
jgi:hypothetical protein